MITPRFISIRGTNGSGKSTLVTRALREPGLFNPPRPYHVIKRYRPLYYVRWPPAGSGGRLPLAVLGSYEAVSGGCDTIAHPDEVFQLTRKLLAAGHDVLAEGLLLSKEQGRTLALHHEGVPVHLFYLALSLEECLIGLNARRVARGVKPWSLEVARTKDIAARLRQVALQPPRFRAAGVNVAEGDREAAAEWLRGLGVLP